MSYNTEYNYQPFVETLFNERDLVYSSEKSKNGILEKIFIKRINFISIYDYNYQDSDNRIWLENELCDFEEATNNISNYNLIQGKRYESLVDKFVFKGQSITEVVPNV